MKSLKRRLSTLAALACLFYSNGALRANDVRWAGNPDLNDDNWTDYGNWNNRTRPDSTSTTRVFFGDNVGRANSNQDLGNFYSLGQIIFDATSTNYNIFGESISLYSGIFVNGSSSQHISFDMAMQNDVTIGVNGANLTLDSANIYGNGHTLTFNSKTDAGTAGTTVHNVYFGGNYQNGGGNNASGLSVNDKASVFLNHSNSFTGATSISGGVLTASAGSSLGSTSGITVNSSGTLALGNNAGNYTGSDHINDNAGITLNGGAFNTGGFSEYSGTYNGVTGSPAAGIGALTLSANSIIDMGSSAGSIIAFANSSGKTWTGTLSIYNWTGTAFIGDGTDQIFFGTDNTGLMQSQLNSIRFYSNNGTTFLGTAGFAIDGLGSDGEIVPVPEPSTWAAGILAVGAIGFSQRRRFVRLLKVA